MYNIQGIGKVREDIFFTADYRFFDVENNRGYDDVIEMNEKIIQNHNELVNKRDIVYMLGNFSFGNPSETLKILNRLNGRINLIVGGYDSQANILSHKKKLASCNYKLDYMIDDNYVTLNSFPQMHWHKKEKGAYHLFGYLQGSIPPPQGLAMDVCIDNNDFYPYNWEDIKDIMKNKREYIHFNNNTVNEIWL